MPDNRVAPASHSANVTEDVSAAHKGSASSELRGLHSAAVAGAGGDAPVRSRIDGAVAADPQAKNAELAPKNTSPMPEPVAKAFPESWREDLSGGDKAFRRTLDRFESP